MKQLSLESKIYYNKEADMISLDTVNKFDERLQAKLKMNNQNLQDEQWKNKMLLYKNQQSLYCQQNMV